MTAILEALRRLRGGHIDERSLQDEVARLLNVAGIPFTPEHRFSATDRIDFLAGPVGIECKIKGAPIKVARQCYRYAEHVRELLLVTTQQAHAEYIAGPIISATGKPCRVEVLNIAFRFR